MMRYKLNPEESGQKEILEEALALLPHSGIEGLATLSSWKDGSVIKLRVNPEYDLELILPKDYLTLQRDGESILFHTGGYRFFAFHQR